MKSQIQVFFLIFHGLVVSPMDAQPKISIDLGLGIYEPLMEGFDDNTEVFFPADNVLNRNMLLNWGVYYEFFSNARIGYNSYLSYDFGKLNLQNSKPVFSRSIQYRMVPLETFFRWRPRIELNFTLALIWGRGKLTVETKPAGKTDDWNELLNSFGDNDPMDEMGSSDVMISDWIGFSGMLGIRYYLSSRLGIDFKAGFFNNYYNHENWRIYSTKVQGPEMTINDLPIFSLKVIYGLK